MAVLVLEPERLVKEHDFKSLTIDGEKRNPHQTENAFGRKTVLDLVLDKRLPSFGLGTGMEPIAHVEQRDRGENRNESFHALAVLTAQRQNSLSSQPCEPAHH